MFIKPLIFLALCVKALSLPTNDQTLDKRKQKAWIASFNDDDNSCKNTTSVNSYINWPMSDSHCVPFASQDSRVGGQWGNIVTIETFIDDSCTEHHSFLPPRNGSESGFCVLLNETGDGGDMDDLAFWNSVKGYASTSPGWWNKI